MLEYEGQPHHGLSMRGHRSSSHAGQPLSPGPGGLNLSLGDPTFLDGKRYDHCFKIITAKRTFLLCAPVSTSIGLGSMKALFLTTMRNGRMRRLKSNGFPP